MLASTQNNVGLAREPRRTMVDHRARWWMWRLINLNGIHITKFMTWTLPSKPTSCWGAGSVMERACIEHVWSHAMIGNLRKRGGQSGARLTRGVSRAQANGWCFRLALCHPWRSPRRHGPQCGGGFHWMGAHWDKANLWFTFGRTQEFFVNYTQTILVPKRMWMLVNLGSNLRSKWIMKSS